MQCMSGQRGTTLRRHEQKTSTPQAAGKRTNTRSDSINQQHPSEI